MSLYVLRHGETAWSRDRRHTGRTDIPLTERGERQATRAGESLAQRRGDGTWRLVLSSPLLRAAATARLAGCADVEVDRRLAEWDYGEYEGRTTDDIQAQRPAWDLWRDGCPGGELPAEVGRRVDDLLTERVRPVLQCGDVLLVAHSHLLRVLTARWLGLPAAAGSGFVLDAAGYGILDSEHGYPALRGWNLR